MKKVLIISYFFPPANFVGAERTAAWIKYLPNKGVYPILITRQWNNNQKDLKSKIERNFLEIEKTNQYEIHRLSHKFSLRDWLANHPRLSLFQKALTFWELIFSNFFIRALPYSNFYFYTKQYLNSNKDVDVVIATGRPFQTFFIGYLLKKQFENIHWIPDYRDEWNSHQNRVPTSFLQKFIFRLEKRSEIKWTSNASFFISVSEYWVESIGKLIRKNGVVIKNGYDEMQVNVHKNENNLLTMAYIGTLYPIQPINLIINLLIKLKQGGMDNLVFHFVGIDTIPEQELRVKKLIEGYEDTFKVHPRMPKKDIDFFYRSIDLLYLTNYDNIKGWYPVKLFDYYKTQRPILLFPSDCGEIQDFILKTNCGFVANSLEDCECLLLKLYSKKINNKSIDTIINKEEGKKYSREYQTDLLAKFILGLSS